MTEPIAFTAVVAAITLFGIVWLVWALIARVRYRASLRRMWDEIQKGTNE